jgi:hypothetical protein
VDQADAGELLSRLDEVEGLLRFPTDEGRMLHAVVLLLSIARAAPNPGVRELAMQVINEVNDLRRAQLSMKLSEGAFNKLNWRLWRLRWSLEEARRGGPGFG